MVVTCCGSGTVMVDLLWFRYSSGGDLLWFSYCSGSGPTGVRFEVQLISAHFEFA